LRSLLEVRGYYHCFASFHDVLSCLFSSLKGLRKIAQGCRAERLPWDANKSHRQTPTGFRNPVGVHGIVCRVTQGNRLRRQPWANFRKPVGL
jgi:hypothetical protein